MLAGTAGNSDRNIPNMFLPPNHRQSTNIIFSIYFIWVFVMVRNSVVFQLTINCINNQLHCLRFYAFSFQFSLKCCANKRTIWKNKKNKNHWRWCMTGIPMKNEIKLKFIYCIIGLSAVLLILCVVKLNSSRLLHADHTRSVWTMAPIQCVWNNRTHKITKHSSQFPRSFLYSFFFLLIYS